jgi:hypothetical protein
MRAQVEIKEDRETQKMPRSFFPIYPRTIFRGMCNSTNSWSVAFFKGEKKKK